jgi:hypothetical protein
MHNDGLNLRVNGLNMVGELGHYNARFVELMLTQGVTLPGQEEMTLIWCCAVE